MKQRRVVVDSLPQAYKVIKEMNLNTDESEYRSAGRQTLEAVCVSRKSAGLARPGQPIDLKRNFGIHPLSISLP